MDHMLYSLWLVLLTVSLSAARFTLNPISVLYVPYEFDEATGDGLHGLVKGVSKQSSYSYTDENQLLYIAGDNYLQIANITDADSPTIIFTHPFSPYTANDVVKCGGYAAFLTNSDLYKNAPGILHLRRAYDITSGIYEEFIDIPVGSVPKSVEFTDGCQTLVVINAGEYGETDVPGVFIDPEGTVSIIRLGNGSHTINNLDFTGFNERSAEYEAKGVRYPFKNSTFSQNLEPKYISIDLSNSMAYISLQQNNAIAVINIATDTIEEIYSLGVKSWKDLNLDASDSDEGIVFQNYDIFSLYLPDAIKYFKFNGTGYIATANEGSSSDYHTLNNEKRGRSLVEDGLVSDDLPLKSSLNLDSELGRLKFSLYDSIDASSGEIDKLTFLGGRSISIRRASDMSLVYDSGDVIEVKSAEFLTNVFNTDTRPLSSSPEDNADSTSDDFGPQCESLAFGGVGETGLLFVGIEGLSAIGIFTFAPGSAVPEFDSFYRAGGTGKSYNELLVDRNVGDLDPEGIEFIPSQISPTGKDMLIVTNNIAGTVALYDVIDNSE